MQVVKAKDGAGSATLSMAYARDEHMRFPYGPPHSTYAYPVCSYAGAEFTEAVLRGRAGEKGVKYATFVKSSVTEAACVRRRAGAICIREWQAHSRLHNIMRMGHTGTSRRRASSAPTAS